MYTASTREYVQTEFWYALTEVRIASRLLMMVTQKTNKSVYLYGDTLFAFLSTPRYRMIGCLL